MQEVCWQSQELNCLLSSSANASAMGQASWAGMKLSLSLPFFRFDREKKLKRLDREKEKK